MDLSGREKKLLKRCTERPGRPLRYTVASWLLLAAAAALLVLAALDVVHVMRILGKNQVTFSAVLRQVTGTDPLWDCERLLGIVVPVGLRITQFGLHIAMSLFVIITAIYTRRAAAFWTLVVKLSAERSSTAGGELDEA